MIKLKDILLEAGRIPRKKGQKRKSKKHSDLYTDENPKGTIHGLKFATVKDAEASIRKIKSSGRKHAHKVQAAVAMEQRAKAAGKKSAAAVYRRYINSVKKSEEIDEKFASKAQQRFMFATDPKSAKKLASKMTKKDYDELPDKVREVDYHSKLSRGHKPDYYQLGTSDFKPFDRSEDDVEENFADGKKKGRKGLSKRVGVSQKMSISKLAKIAKTASGERKRMAQWNLNMKRGRKKKK